MTSEMLSSQAGCSKWLGLVVDQVELSHLEEVANSGYTTWRSLPVEMIAFPVDDLKKVAVVSWRWDIDAGDHPSRNLYSIILYAKKAKLRHLFVDVISIDQKLEGDALLEQVRLFTDLYRIIPVITAYDKPNCDLLSSMQRPWIASEITAFKYNPTSIVNIRHDTRRQPRLKEVHMTHFNSLDANLLYDPVIGEDRRYGFTGRAALIWRTGTVTTIFKLMFGTVQMQNVFDLKYIMPSHAPLLIAAEKQFPKNDYLLTAALLAQHDQNLPGHNRDAVSIKQGILDLSSMNFSFYRIESVGDRWTTLPQSLEQYLCDHLWMQEVRTQRYKKELEAIRAYRGEEFHKYMYRRLVTAWGSLDDRSVKITHTVSLGSVRSIELMGIL